MAAPSAQRGKGACDGEKDLRTLGSSCVHRGPGESRDTCTHSSDSSNWRIRGLSDLYSYTSPFRINV